MDWPMKRLLINSLAALLCLAAAPVAGAAEEERAAPETKEACEAAGGEWGHWGFLSEERCNERTNDAGKVCHDSEECEGACLAELDASAERLLMRGGELALSGRCSERKLVYGCHPFVRKGKVKGILCVD